MVLKIDDELMKRIEAAAAELNVTPDEFAERVLRQALPLEFEIDPVSGLSILKLPPGVPAISSEEVERALEDR
jgi:hypothetical protein